MKNKIMNNNNVGGENGLLGSQLPHVLRNNRHFEKKEFNKLLARLSPFHQKQAGRHHSNVVQGHQGGQASKATRASWQNANVKPNQNPAGGKFGKTTGANVGKLKQSSTLTKKTKLFGAFHTIQHQQAEDGLQERLERQIRSIQEEAANEARKFQTVEATDPMASALQQTSYRDPRPQSKQPAYGYASSASTYTHSTAQPPISGNIAPHRPSVSNQSSSSAAKSVIMAQYQRNSSLLKNSKIHRPVLNNIDSSNSLKRSQYGTTLGGKQNRYKDEQLKRQGRFNNTVTKMAKSTPNQLRCSQSQVASSKTFTRSIADTQLKPVMRQVKSSTKLKARKNPNALVLPNQIRKPQGPKAGPGTFGRGHTLSKPPKSYADPSTGPRYYGSAKRPITSSAPPQKVPQSQRPKHSRATSAQQQEGFPRARFSNPPFPPGLAPRYSVHDRSFVSSAGNQTLGNQSTSNLGPQDICLNYGQGGRHNPVYRADAVREEAEYAAAENLNQDLIETLREGYDGVLVGSPDGRLQPAQFEEINYPMTPPDGADGSAALEDDPQHVHIVHSTVVNKSTLSDYTLQGGKAKRLHGVIRESRNHGHPNGFAADKNNVECTAVVTSGGASQSQSARENFQSSGRLDLLGQTLSQKTPVVSCLQNQLPNRPQQTYQPNEGSPTCQFQHTITSSQNQDNLRSNSTGGNKADSLSLKASNDHSSKAAQETSNQRSQEYMPLQESSVNFRSLQNQKQRTPILSSSAQLGQGQRAKGPSQLSRSSQGSKSNKSQSQPGFVVRTALSQKSSKSQSSAAFQSQKQQRVTLSLGTRSISQNKPPQLKSKQRKLTLENKENADRLLPAAGLDLLKQNLSTSVTETNADSRHNEVIQVRHMQIANPLAQKPMGGAYRDPVVIPSTSAHDRAVDSSGQMSFRGSSVLTPPSSGAEQPRAPSSHNSNFEELKNKLNDISAISPVESCGPTPTASSIPSTIQQKIQFANDIKVQKIKSKINEYVDQITWDKVRDSFVQESRESEDMPASTLKAGKALCYAVQLYIQDPNYETHKKLSKIKSIRQYLQKHRNSIENLKKNVNNFLSQFPPHEQLDIICPNFVKSLRTQIFGKLLDEQKNKDPLKGEKKLMQSPRVRNAECKPYFAFAYFSMLYFNKLNEYKENRDQNDSNHGHRPHVEEQKIGQRYQFRSSIANQICQTLKSKFNKEIVINTTFSAQRSEAEGDSQEKSKLQNEEADFDLHYQDPPHQNQNSNPNLNNGERTNCSQPQPQASEYMDCQKPDHPQADAPCLVVEESQRSRESRKSIQSQSVQSGVSMTEDSVSSVLGQPNILPSNSVRNVGDIVETTQNFIQIMDSCTKQQGVKVPFYHERRGGIRVEDLINKFKSESKFDTMSKSKGKNKKKRSGKDQKQSTKKSKEKASTPGNKSEENIDFSSNLQIVSPIGAKQIQRKVPLADTSDQNYQDPAYQGPPMAVKNISQTLQLQNSKSNDLYSPHECVGPGCAHCVSQNDLNDIQIVKIPFNDRRAILGELANDLMFNTDSANGSHRSPIISQLSENLQHQTTTGAILIHESCSLRQSLGQGQGGSNGGQSSWRTRQSKEAQFACQVHHIPKTSKDTQESKESKIQLQSNLDTVIDDGVFRSSALASLPSHDLRDIASQSDSFRRGIDMAKEQKGAASQKLSYSARGDLFQKQKDGSGLKEPTLNIETQFEVNGLFSNPVNLLEGFGTQPLTATNIISSERVDRNVLKRPSRNVQHQQDKEEEMKEEAAKDDEDHLAYDPEAPDVQGSSERSEMIQEIKETYQAQEDFLKANRTSDLLEQTSQALDLAAGDGQQYSPMLVVLTSYRSNPSNGSSNIGGPDIIDVNGKGYLPSSRATGGRAGQANSAINQQNAAGVATSQSSSKNNETQSASTNKTGPTEYNQSQPYRNIDFGGQNQQQFTLAGAQTATGTCSQQTLIAIAPMGPAISYQNIQQNGNGGLDSSEQKEGQPFGFKTPRVVQLLSTDRSQYGATAEAGARALAASASAAIPEGAHTQAVQLLNDQSPLQILQSQNSGGQANISESGTYGYHTAPCAPRNDHGIELKRSAEDLSSLKISPVRMDEKGDNGKTEEMIFCSFSNQNKQSIVIKHKAKDQELDPSLKAEQPKQPSKKLQKHRKNHSEADEIHRLHRIIENIENLKRERANSGDRQNTQQLKRLTDAVIQQNLVQISQIQGGGQVEKANGNEEDNLGSKVREFNIDQSQFNEERCEPFEFAGNQNQLDESLSNDQKQSMSNQPPSSHQIQNQNGSSFLQSRHNSSITTAKPEYEDQISSKKSPFYGGFGTTNSKKRGLARVASSEKYRDVSRIQAQKDIDAKIMRRAKGILQKSGQRKSAPLSSRKGSCRKAATATAYSVQ